jgi:hypothetical protein
MGGTSFPPPPRLALAQARPLAGPTAPVRRVWRPHPGSTEPSPLGLPTLAARARQTRVKSVREPAWEARCAPNS